MANPQHKLDKTSVVYIFVLGRQDDVVANTMCRFLGLNYHYYEHYDNSWLELREKNRLPTLNALIWAQSLLD